MAHIFICFWLFTTFSSYNMLSVTADFSNLGVQVDQVSSRGGSSRSSNGGSASSQQSGGSSRSSKGGSASSQQSGASLACSQGQSRSAPAPRGPSQGQHRGDATTSLQKMNDKGQKSSNRAWQQGTHTCRLIS